MKKPEVFPNQKLVLLPWPDNDPRYYLDALRAVNALGAPMTLSGLMTMTFSYYVNHPDQIDASEFAFNQIVSLYHANQLTLKPSLEAVESMRLQAVLEEVITQVFLSFDTGFGRAFRKEKPHVVSVSLAGILVSI